MDLLVLQLPTVSKIFERLMQKQVNTLISFCLIFSVVTEKYLVIKLLYFG